MANAYSKSVRERAFKPKRPSQEEIIAAMKQQGLEASGGSYDPQSGDVRYSYSRQKEEKPMDKLKQIKMAMAGITDPQVIGREMGVEEPRYQAPKPQAQVMTPDGMQGIVSKADAPFDVPNYYQQALQKKFAPGLSQGQISSDVLGLPQEGVSSPEELTGEVSTLKESVNSPEELKEGLASLAFKYQDNEEAMKKIKALIGIVNSSIVKKQVDTLTYESLGEGY